MMQYGHTLFDEMPLRDFLLLGLTDLRTIQFLAMLRGAQTDDFQYI